MKKKQLNGETQCSIASGSWADSLHVFFQYVLVISAVILVRWAVSLNGYSGFNKPSMYGDFEAQRHWMEITKHLPLEEWYVHGPKNDLQYWGLDYPPLTAYHSKLLGHVSHRINASWVALGSSHGVEDPDHKLFMRVTVLFVDILMYLLPLVAYMNLEGADSLTCLGNLLYPGLILIDHGHFQYNCVSLGLTVLAVLWLQQGKDGLGTMAFVAALSYKQMSLYHALPFFFYLLGKCWSGRQNFVIKLLKLSTAVIAMFVLIWWPFITQPRLMIQVLHRLFPFARGLFEDKVANFWCSISVLIKLKSILSQPQLVRLCLVTTLLCLMPSSIMTLRRPTMTNFKLSLLNSSLIFFLFSYQVHEKSILLAAIPAILLSKQHPLAVTWFLLVSTFSMFPLLVKDNLVMPCLALSIIYCSLSVRHVMNLTIKPLLLLFVLSLTGCILLTFGSLFIPPLLTLPDLWPLLISVYSAFHFIMFLLHFHYLQYELYARDAIKCKSS